MCLHLFHGDEKALGPEHTLTLWALKEQDKLDQAEQRLVLGLARKEKALGLDHAATLDTVDSLGSLYIRQGKMDQAERMYVLAFAGKENAFGLDHDTALSSVNNLRILYKNQDKVTRRSKCTYEHLPGTRKH